MKPRITHELLDLYLQVAGDPDMVPKGTAFDGEAWELLAELMLDLHLIRHGYADEGYAKHVDRLVRALHTEEGVTERIRALNA